MDTDHVNKDHAQALIRAEAGVAALAARRSDRWYPQFHIASDGGWINDPNGLCYYHGRWHVFYQLHPYGTQWGPMHWGHVSSKDMVTWRREPVALAPSLEQDRDGVFSGSAVIGDDGRLRLFYTGNITIQQRGENHAEELYEAQMLAEAQDDDARIFTKRGVAVAFPEGAVHSDFRDPKVWKQDGYWYMIVGARSARERGQIWLYTSQDLVSWEFSRVLYEHPDPDVYMLECPDFFALRSDSGGMKWVLCFSAMGSKPCGFMNRNANNAGYMIGTWEPDGCFQPETGFRLWDWGHNFYAPQSFEGPDSRRIMYGWMSPEASRPVPVQEDGWCGNLTLPRELALDKDGSIRITPVKETEALRASQCEFGRTSLGAEEQLVIAEESAGTEIEMVIDLNSSTAERCGLKVHAGGQGSYTYIAYDDQTQRIVVDRQAAAEGGRGYRAAPLSSESLSSGRVALRIFIDRGCVEAYINNGEQVMSSFSYPVEGPGKSILLAERGTMEIESLTVHRLRGIGLS